MTMNYVSNDLIDQAELRNKLIDRVDVLNKVKELFLIPKLEMIPAKYVAEYYDIDYQALNQCIKRNHEELESDGILTCTLTRIQREVQDVTPVKQVDRVHFSITVNDNVEYIVHNGKNTYLSPRAVLRIGMLLRDSEVAKEVRTQLLNTFEHTTVEQRISDITEEEHLALRILRAENSCEVTLATKNLMDFYNRRNAVLVAQNEALESKNADLQESNSNLQQTNTTLMGENIGLKAENTNLNTELDVAFNRFSTWEA